MLAFSSPPLPVLSSRPSPLLWSRGSRSSLLPSRHALLLSHCRLPAYAPTASARAPTPAATDTATPPSPRLLKYTDCRGHDWTYPLQAFPPDPTAGDPGTPLLLLHTPTGLGVSRTYWDRAIPELRASALRRYPVHTFDWVGNGASTPKPASLPVPYDASFYVHNLAHVTRQLAAPPILVVQGAAEVVALLLAARHPDLVRGVFITNGLSTRYLTTNTPAWRKRISYDVLKGPAGRAFWQLVANERYISGFSRKNLLLSDKVITPWVQRAVQGAVDPAIRFSVFSFISGHLFGDFTKEFSEIRVPVYFSAGALTPQVGVRETIKSARPPIPIVATESSFRDQRANRLTDRKALIPGCEGEVLDEGGPEMWFEQPELALSSLQRFLESIGA